MGSDDVFSSRLALGTSGFGSRSSERGKETDAIHCAFDCGVRIFDTAPMYADGRAEGLLGNALSGWRRQDSIIVTKIHPYEATSGQTVSECEGSLKRMGVDYIDLYLVHWRGPVPISETVEALERLKQSGKIRDWGVSNFDRDDFLEVNQYRKSERPLANQVLYNPRRRTPECRFSEFDATRLLLMAYSPFERDRPLDFAPFVPIASRLCTDVHAVLLAWILSKGFIPIFKSTRLDHIKHNCDLDNVYFLPAELEAIDDAFPLPVNPVRMERHDTV